MSGTNGMLPTAFVYEPPNKSDRIHQSQKPVELYKEIEKYITKEFEKVLDQFAGSGSLGQASLEMQRDSILFEIDSEMVDNIIKDFQSKSLKFEKVEEMEYER